MISPFFFRIADSYLNILGTIAVGVLTLIVVVLVRYQASVRRRLLQLNESSFFGKTKDPFRMVRVSSNMNPDRNTSFPLQMRLVDLNPEFVKSNSQWKLLSLSEYFASLRPGVVSDDKRLPEWMESEIQAGLAAALLKAFGPQFGTAVLPALGASGIENQVQKVAGGAAAYLISRWSNTVGDETTDRSGIPISVFAMTFLAEMNYQRAKRSRSPKKTQGTQGPPSPLELLKMGEVGFKPYFAATGDVADSVTVREQSDEDICVLLPNPFVLSEHWEEAISAMERLLQGSGVGEWKSTDTTDSESLPQPSRTYNPDSKAMKQPEPISERFLPDLCIGWGSAECTHTQQEILKNRLLSVLLNRLASNYHFWTEKAFEVCVDRESERISKPSELIQLLIKMGHSIQAAIRSHVTTFGVALCVRENDDTWSNIPLAYFMANGYVDAEGREGFSCLPHSGLDLEIRGGTLMQNCCIQHFMGTEGFCGWQSNHNANVPWILDVDCGEVMHGEKAAEGVRMAALEANVINGVGTKFQLPFGGYGLNGVCNDSAGLLEYALFGKTHVYPLTFSGQWAMHNLRFARKLRHRLEQFSHAVRDVEALDRLIDAISSLPSDINSLPSEAADQCRRQLHCLHPQLPFALMRQTKEVILSIREELEK